jgi:hypothetical protein
MAKCGGVTIESNGGKRNIWRRNKSRKYRKHQWRNQHGVMKAKINGMAAIAVSVMAKAANLNGAAMKVMAASSAKWLA